MLANDGLIRWLGEPVGRIMAGGHILTPQVRVIADEQLTGPAPLRAPELQPTGGKPARAAKQAR